MRRAKRITDVDTNDSESTAPPIMPPEGIPATVETKVRYQTRVDPESEQRRESRSLYGRELEELAASESDRLNPPDELAVFCEEYADYIGWSCVVVRLPDPAIRRTPGSQYRRPCFELERLGDTPFDPVNLIGTLQMLNGNSGGVFRIFLVDPNGAPVPGASVTRIVVADPPGQTENRNQRSEIRDQRFFPAPVERQKSDTEVRMERLQEQILQAAFDRMLNPPLPPAPVSSLSGEDQAALFLFKQTNFLGTMFERMTALAQNPADALKEASWKERMIDAGVELVKTNPAIVERVSGVVERVVARILPDPRLDGVQAAESQQSEVRSQPPEVVALPLRLPPTPTQTVDEEDEDPEIMNILDGLIGLLNSRKILTAGDPVLIELHREYPLKFQIAARLIATNPVSEIVQWVSAQSPLYESLLSSEVSGPFLVERIAELQKVFQAAMNKSAPPPTETATPTDDQIVK